MLFLKPIILLPRSSARINTTLGLAELWAKTLASNIAHNSRIEQQCFVDLIYLRLGRTAIRRASWRRTSRSGACVL
jgi:hypothetical protein